jgi:hypothetical protein
MPFEVISLEGNDTAVWVFEETFDRFLQVYQVDETIEKKFAYKSIQPLTS